MNFGLIKSFQIDSGELEGLSPQECFVLGYELATIDARLKANESIKQQLVHAANKSRIEDACMTAKRPYKLSWMPADISEEWMLLDV